MTAPIVVQGASRALMPGLFAGLMGSAGVAYGPQLFKKESSEVSQLVAALASLRQGPGVTVVTNPNGNRLASVSLTAACLTGAGVLVLKLAGISLTSFFWVTRRHFRKGMLSLEKGMEGLTKRITEVRVGLLAKIEQLMGKQDKLASSQNEIRNDLNSLSIKVGQVEGGIHCVKGVIDAVAQKIDSVELKVDESSAMLQQSHQGVLLLCRIVSNTIEHRETSYEEAKMLREFAEKRSLEPPKHSPFMPATRPAVEDRCDYLREMVAARKPMPVVGLGCATDFTKRWASG